MKNVTKPNIRSAIKNIPVAIFGCVAALILLEIGARQLPPPIKGPVNESEVCAPQLGWRGKPHYQTTVATEGYYHDLSLNSRGMHDSEHALPKPENSFRVLLLGDSFVQAVQVKESETTHHILEARLNEAIPQQQVEVISAGAGGWGTAQQLIYYRQEGRQYNPDLVLLMFYLGNDVKDNLPGRGITVDGHNCYAAYFTLCPDNRLDTTPWVYAPGLEPAVGRCGSAQKVVNNTLGKLYQSSRLYAQIEPLFAPNPIEASMLDFYIGRNETFDYALQLTVALVDQLQQEVRQDGAKFGVVLISPLALLEFTQMDKTEREEIYQRLPAMKRAEEIDPPNQQLAQVFSNQGSPVLDLLPVFIEHTQQTDQPLYFEQDKHWNPAGNRLAGQAIYRWLVDTYQLN